MKQLIMICTILFILQGLARAQDSMLIKKPQASATISDNSAHSIYSSEYYMIKSKKYKSTAWVLASLGTALGITGLIIYENRKDYDLAHLEDDALSYSGAIALMAVGGTLVVVSIPVFISSGNYRKKALNMSATLKLESLQNLKIAGISVKNYPAVGLNIRL